MTSLSEHAELFYFDEDYSAARKVSKLQLESPDVEDLVSKAKGLATARNLLFPDMDALLERCVVSLLSGHIVLQGPPGTGKTTLAYILAEAFKATAQLETATADWSTYDVVGGLHPTAKGGIETLVPWLGHVPRAALDCASVVARNVSPEENEAHQAHWLIIDEFSRAEIDKAIGPLYTVLGGGDNDVPLPLWFEHDPQKKEVWLPKRFRIIATMNTVDTNYVYTFSQGLSRRFQFIHVGVPSKEQVTDELKFARRSAQHWLKGTYPNMMSSEDFVGDLRVSRASEILSDLLTTLRYDDATSGRPGWPLGTAQIVDVYRQLALRMQQAGSEAEALVPALDLALADRVIPQAGNLTKTQLDAFDEWLGRHQLPRTSRALQHLRAASSTGY
jgi:DNA polymerase III delta prime subunit